mmetsp:Transcript_83327/g.139269  ORF Transcript_83327/g.139269 Transcript_83327/m.139269 type:complete len:85 (+) Transcript_83327:179-433(+)
MTRMCQMHADVEHAQQIPWEQVPDRELQALPWEAVRWLHTVSSKRGCPCPGLLSFVPPKTNMEGSQNGTNGKKAPIEGCQSTCR